MTNSSLTLNAPIVTKVVCFSRLLHCLRRFYDKQCGPRSDCSYRSSLFWIHAVCFYTEFVSNVRQLFAVDDFSKRNFQMLFFLGALRFFLNIIIRNSRERSGSVVECLTRDRRAADSSLTGVTALWSLSKTHLS